MRLIPLNLIKGGGGALLARKDRRPSQPSRHHRRGRKQLSNHLGTRFKLPVEVFSLAAFSARYLESLGAKVKSDRTPMVRSSLPIQESDSDCDFGPIADHCSWHPL